MRLWLIAGLSLLAGCHWDMYIKPETIKLGPGQSVKLRLKLEGTGAGTAMTDAGGRPRFDIPLSLSKPACGELLRPVLERVEAWGPEVEIEFTAADVSNRCVTDLIASFDDQGHPTSASARLYVEKH